MADFGERLRELRKSRNVSQKELSSLIRVSERALRYYETMNRQPTIEQLITLADFFNVSLDYLVGRSDDHSPFRENGAS
ncbi:helix-turn-helix domain-containing protein [Sulfoacidibacillus thermotolerans]|uniref:helix-turn-helix domain-containing protein n=1 Tax=Sulfoacidibacillus thermotolerans TaxID=1765684 RepID=UPI000D68AF27|nr:helix-turn-helix transcriptional regulator [Sulfoacidibacillus thermotolerans]